MNCSVQLGWLGSSSRGGACCEEAKSLVSRVSETISDTFKSKGAHSPQANRATAHQTDGLMRAGAERDLYGERCPMLRCGLRSDAER